MWRTSAATVSSGRSRDEIRAGYRSFLVREYVVFYRIPQSGVEIMRVLHGRRYLKAFFRR